LRTCGPNEPISDVGAKTFQDLEVPRRRENFLRPLLI
jgi:hypothetical protein